MSQPDDESTPRYLMTPDAAVILGLSARTLEKHRCYGTGPAFYKLGGRVVYSVDDLHAWVRIGARRSTRDTGTGIIYPAKRRPEGAPAHAGPVQR
jgi:hypothetical protein